MHLEESDREPPGGGGPPETLRDDAGSFKGPVTGDPGAGPAPKRPGRRWRWILLLGAFLAGGVVILVLGCSTVVVPATAVQGEDTEGDGGLEAWGTVLARHVDAAGTVDYAGLRRDRALLERAYRDVAARSPVSHPEAFPTEADRLAYWIDAYNITVLVGVAHYDVQASVTDVAAPFLLRWFVPDGAGFFYFTRFLYGDRSHSLYAVEHDVIRAGFGEPRIHFAINCASKSCPILESRPFRGDDLDRRLDVVTRRFVADDRHVRVDVPGKVVRLSAILDWFAEDFPDRLGFLIMHASGPKRAALDRARREAFDVEFHDYDWRLNAR